MIAIVRSKGVSEGEAVIVVVVGGEDAEYPLGLLRGRLDNSGRFLSTSGNPGSVSVRVDVLGYESALETDVILRTSRSTYVEFRLERKALELEGIVVGAPAFRVLEAAPVSTQLLSNQELRRTPGGLQDVSRTLLSLPGVLGGVDNRNDLLVTGGGPGENA